MRLPRHWFLRNKKCKKALITFHKTKKRGWVKFGNNFQYPVNPYKKHPSSIKDSGWFLFACNKRMSKKINLTQPLLDVFDYLLIIISEMRSSTFWWQSPQPVEQCVPSEKPACVHVGAVPPSTTIECPVAATLTELIGRDGERGLVLTSAMLGTQGKQKTYVAQASRTVKRAWHPWMTVYFIFHITVTIKKTRLSLPI